VANVDTFKINADMDAFVTAVQKYGADAFDGITIGNEVQDDALNIMNKVWDVRGALLSFFIWSLIKFV
jgi:hypothetical protein